MITRFLLFIILILSCSCLDDEDYRSLSEGMPVSVNLQLGVASLDAIGTTKSDETTSVFMSQTESLSLIIKEETIPLSTKAGSSISDCWVLQFGGTTPDAALIGKRYYTSMSAVRLISSAVSHRIVIVANTANSSLFSNFSGNYASFQNLFMSVSLSSLKEFYSGEITSKITAGVTVDVSLKRVLAKVTFNIKSILSDYSNWSVQVKNVPSKAYYLPSTKTAPFPVVEGFINDQQIKGIKLSSMSSYTFSRLIAPNLRGLVPGVTNDTRVEKAPNGSSFLEIIGENVRDNKKVTYTVHLGENFTNSYNIRPNTAISYTILLSGLNSADDRVVISELDPLKQYSVAFRAGVNGSVSTPTGSGINGTVATARAIPAGSSHVLEGWYGNSGKITATSGSVYVSGNTLNVTLSSTTDKSQYTAKFKPSVTANSSGFRITWNNGRYELTDDTNVAGLYFKFGSVVGIFSAEDRVATSAKTHNGLKFSAPQAIAYAPDPASIPYPFWDRIPFFRGFGPIPHTALSVRAGMGDPCRLVGLDLDKIKHTPAGDLSQADIDNGQWRMPCLDDIITLANTYGPWQYKGYWGAFFGDGAFLTAGGLRDINGVVQQQQYDGYYWLNNIYDETSARGHKYSEATSGVVRSEPYWWTGRQSALVVRCIPQ